MNYKKIYNTLIDRATHRISEGYVEKHHIVPQGWAENHSKAMKKYYAEKKETV